MILARNSFLRPWGVCRHKGHCRHQTCQGMALLPSCFSHISPELKGTWRILQELLSPLLGSEGICYRTAELRIFLHLGLSSPALQRVPFWSTATAAPRTGTLNRSEPGAAGAKDSGQGCTHTTEQARAGCRGAAPLAPDIKHTASPARHGREGHLQEMPVPVTHSISHPCRGTRSVLLALEGATGITSTLHVEACSWRQVEGTLLLCLLHLQYQVQRLDVLQLSTMASSVV